MDMPELGGARNLAISQFRQGPVTRMTPSPVGQKIL